MTKKEARAAAKARRALLDMHRVGEAMAARLFALPAWARTNAVLAFAAMPDEPDTDTVLRRALSEGKRLFLPRVLSKSEMDWVEITVLAQLVRGAYGIWEPPRSFPAADVTALDGALALIPCLSVSPGGVRLGRGGGYYDRFLAQYKGERLLLCPEAAVLPDLPCEAWDARFAPEEILTEKGLYTP